MKVLVTGATGFTGGHLARRLAATGDTVRVVVRHPDQASALRDAGLDVVGGDLTDAASLERACEGVDVVYNIPRCIARQGCPTRPIAP